MAKRLYLLYIPLLYFSLIGEVINAVNRHERNYVIWSDSEGYYMYLPGLFIIKDFHQIPSGSVLPQLNEKGEHVIKYTCGVAMLEAPFFLVAKWYCQIRGYEWKDYFNKQYMMAMAISGYTYGFIGLFFLAATLRRQFSERIVFWTILSVFLGTNLFHYMMRSMAMSHAYSFCLFAMIAWLTPQWYCKPTFLKTISIGLLFGLCVLIRPTNAVILLFVLLYNVYSLSQARERIDFYLGHWRKLIVFCIAALAVSISQLLYWYEMTGSIIRYSYTNEAFIYWNKPKVAAVLLDTQNGLFLYSPIVLLMCAGLLIGIELKKYHGLVLALIFCVITYAFASWWAWWFGGAFGHRSYVEYYALFALSLAGFYQHIVQLRSCLLKTLVLLLSTFFMYYGVKMSLLHSQLPGPWDGQDWRWNLEKICWVWSYLF